MSWRVKSIKLDGPDVVIRAVSGSDGWDSWYEAKVKIERSMLATLLDSVMADRADAALDSMNLALSESLRGGETE